jgi:hypothetical protein
MHKYAFVHANTMIYIYVYIYTYIYAWYIYVYIWCIYTGTDGDGAPSDRARHIVQTMPPVFQDLLIALAVILLICFLFMASVLIMYRRSRLLKGMFINTYIYT